MALRNLPAPPEARFDLPHVVAALRPPPEPMPWWFVPGAALVAAFLCTVALLAVDAWIAYGATPIHWHDEARAEARTGHDLDPYPYEVAP